MRYDDLLHRLKDDTAVESCTDSFDVETLEHAPVLRKKAVEVTQHYDKITYDLVIKNACVVTMDSDYRVIKRASVAIKNGIILLITTDNVPMVAHHVIDADEKIITPGLIDSQTHLVYAANRAADMSCQDGGVFATGQANQRASLEELLYQSSKRARVMLDHGTTTVEIKSGYGLDLNTEIKILTVARMLSKRLAITVVPTCLGAHALPSEYKHDPERYIDYVISTRLPVIAKKKLAVFVDAFCEAIAFSSAQTERLFQAAEHYGLKLKLHASQLADQQGALLASRYPVCSVDHIDYLMPENCKHLARDKTVAILLPGAFYFLKESKKPPIAALRSNHIPIAIATDANSGTSPFLTLPLMMNMACVLFGLSMEEAWQGVTINAAKALNLGDELGSIEVGKKADLIVWSTDSLDDVVYNPSINFCKTIIKSGSIVARQDLA